MMYQSERGKRTMPPRENWPWEEKVSKNTQIKLFSDEYLGVNCSLPSQSLDLIIPRRPRGKCVSGLVVQASRIRHRGELTETAWENAVKCSSSALCSKHADAQTALLKCHGYVFENVKCASIHFIHLFCHYHIKHTYISQKF